MLEHIINVQDMFVSKLHKSCRCLICGSFSSEDNEHKTNVVKKANTKEYQTNEDNEHKTNVVKKANTKKDKT